MRIQWLAAPAAALALLAGCGDDDKSAEGPVKPASPDAPREVAGDPPVGGEDAVKQTILTWTFEGPCELMTDKFLEEQAFVGDTREERCNYFRKSFTRPQFAESEVKFRKITIRGDKAVVAVGSDLSDLTTDYHLVAEGGGWRIDSTG